jgi:hypothetical protein
MKIRKETKLDKIVNNVYDELLINTPETPEFQQQIENLERLTALSNKKTRVSPDTVVLVVGNLLGILVIVMYENKHVFTSKALSFTLKPKN